MEKVEVLNEKGEILKPKLVPDLETAEKLYRQMARIRYLDDRFMVLYKQGKMGTYPQFGGQEASQVGTAMALNADDYLVPMYRSTGAAIAFGWSMQQAIMYWRGHPDGWKIPDHLNMMPIIIDIASQYPHAAGVAMGIKMRGEKKVAMTYIGEGGTSEGDFHVGINFAAATDSPAVFVIENNGWAISVPRTVQSKVDFLVRRAEGYGIPGRLVDGNDIFAVYHTAKEAVERARKGDGPTLIEHITYRLRPHTTGDDPKAYRTDEETKSWETRDPILRLKLYLEKQKHWNEDREAAMQAEIESEFNAALEAADNAPAPDPMALLDYTMVNPTPALLEQRADLKKRIEIGN